MKKLVLSGLALALGFSAICQDFKGMWEGTLQGAASLRIVFTFSETGNGLKATMQSPDQAKAIIPTDTAYASGDSIFVTLKQFGVSYRGKLADATTINGVFKQGMEFPLTLKKTEKISERSRPQTPLPPYGYNSRDVQFYNADKSISYAGTLTWPRIPDSIKYVKAPNYPAALLISGSGPQDRDETIMGHKPFAVLADYLTKKGFAILRVDDRGTGKTTGRFDTSTTMDFVSDADAALQFLKRQSEVDSTHMGVIGHSEGGVIAPMLAAKRKDLQFLVLLAAPGVASTQLLEEQYVAASHADGADSLEIAAGKFLMKCGMDAAAKYPDSANRCDETFTAIEKWAMLQDDSLLKRINLDTKTKIKAYAVSQSAAMGSPWYRYFLLIQPQHYLTQVQSNVLALNGSKDVQVLPASNLAGIKAALQKSKSPHYDVKEIPGLNHLFQKCVKCNVGEYGNLEQTFAPEALEIIGNWMLKWAK